MKKAICLFLVTVVFLLFCSVSLAEQAPALEYPVLPNGHPESIMPPVPEPRRGLSVSLSQSGNYTTGPVTWTANVSGGSGAYEYYFQLTGLFPSPWSAVSHNGYYSSANTFRYQFLASGDYTVSVWVNDTERGTSCYSSLTCSIPSSAAFPSISSRVSELVAQCRAAGCSSDYEIALWLHNWLTSNAIYDTNYAHYGPDGVLLGGLGVCDSYSKAYMLLLQEAGIQADRVTNNNHSWNILQLYGDWYYVDATWDDPVVNGISTIVSGCENHVYFCIPDEILGMDHPNYTTPHSCNSYAFNYYTLDGEGAAWADALAVEVQNGLQSSDYSYTFSLADSYTLEGWMYCSDRSTPATVLADNVALLHATIRNYQYEGEPVYLRLSNGDTSDTLASATVNFFSNYLVLPNDLEIISYEAFLNMSGVMVALLPEKVTTIGSRAFAGCSGLWLVGIPPTVTSIGSNAFDSGNTHLTLWVQKDSPAEEYAIQNGLKYSTYAESPSTSGAASAQS